MPTWAVLPLLLLIGIGASGILVPWGYILQTETPPELLGRVTVTATAIPTMLAVCAPPLGALAAKALGVGSVFIFGGIGLAVLAVVVVVGRPRTRGRTILTPDELAAPDAASPS